MGQHSQDRSHFGKLGVGEKIPPVVLVVLALLALVHGARTQLLSDDQDIAFLIGFAFIPARYDSSAVLDGALPGGFGAEIWTFVSYSLIHADWTHFGVNAVWLLPFGSAVERRFGALRFIAFFAVTAAGGAAPPPAPPARGRVPIFLAVWFGINLIFGLGSLSFTGSDQPVAWQAHIGGFLAGLLLFSWFDPAPPRPQYDDIAATRH